MHKFDKHQLTNQTKKIFKDCLLPNGAVTAAPVHQIYYPKDAISYMYVWPGRDMGFALVGLLLLGEDYYEPTLKWIWERSEDFQHSIDPSHEGLLFRNYHVNGRIYLHYLQPDQNGTILWSIGFKNEFTGQKLTELERKVMEKAAWGLAKSWDTDHFIIHTEDLWEERGIDASKGVFSYSLASCAKGMEYAGKLLNNGEYLKVANQMKNTLLNKINGCEDKVLKRMYGKDNVNDDVIDASLVGLVWPFGMGLEKTILKNTIQIIDDELLSEKGIHRYPQDKYEGSQGDWHNHKNEHAGAWPILTFWLSIAHHELGDEQSAKKYFDLVFDSLEDASYHIPEQLFCCEAIEWHGVKPLLWSNCMAVIAAWKLGLL